MKEFEVPDDFIQVPSKVKGIEVFAPKPEEDVILDDVVDFDCPQCGAATAYNLSAGGLKCAHCGYFEPPAKVVVGKGAEDFEFKVETLKEIAHGWGVKRTDLICSNCGAATSFPPGALSALCPFCSSNKVIQQVNGQQMLRPKFLIPFKIDRKDALMAVKQWLGSSWMVPSVVKNLGFQDRLTPLYLPFWTFDAKADAVWNAEVGYDETEHYYNSSTESWETRTVTRWRRERGDLQQGYDDLLVTGTKKVSRLHLRNIQNYQLVDLVEYSPEFLAGIGANSYDSSLEEAWVEGRHMIRENVRTLCRQQIRGDHVRAFELKMDLSDESWRYILLPALVSVFRYRDKTYRILINGQTGKISGQRPADWRKIWLVIASIMAPGILLVAGGYVMSMQGFNGTQLSQVGVGLFVLGLVVMGVILTRAARLDDV